MNLGKNAVEIKKIEKLLIRNELRAFERKRKIANLEQLYNERINHLRSIS